MLILGIDPSSNIVNTSTTGIVLMDNTKLIDSWVVPYGTKNLEQWWKQIGQYLKYDIAVIEKFIVRQGDASRDNSVIHVVNKAIEIIPKLEQIMNTGYGTDIPDTLLKKIGLWKFAKSHHQDLRAAARLVLFYAMRNDIQEIVYEIGDKVYE